MQALRFLVSAVGVVAFGASARVLSACTPVSADALYASRQSTVWHGASSSTTTISAAPEPPPLTRYTGPVWVYVTAAMIAPTTDSGEPWDGPGSMPNSVRQGVRSGITTALRRSLLARVAGGASMATAAGAIFPWIVDVVGDQTAAPDARVNVLLNGQGLGGTHQINNTYYPSWSQRFGPVTIGPTDQLDLHAIDGDLMQDDHIGTCTVQGTPAVDDRGYVNAESFTCHGQFWAVVVRLQPVDCFQPFKRRSPRRFHAIRSPR